MYRIVAISSHVDAQNQSAVSQNPHTTHAIEVQLYVEDNNHRLIQVNMGSETQVWKIESTPPPSSDPPAGFGFFAYSGGC